MLRTEEEALKCWCPFARMLDGWPGNQDGLGGYAAGVNRGLAKASDALCIASGCMAWGWSRRQEVVIYATNEASAGEKLGEGYEFTRNEVGGCMEMRLRDDRRKGFCGLAGGHE